jgi:hypothetical protein
MRIEYEIIQQETGQVLDLMPLDYTAENHKIYCICLVISRDGVLTTVNEPEYVVRETDSGLIVPQSDPVADKAYEEFFS